MSGLAILAAVLTLLTPASWPRHEPTPAPAVPEACQDLEVAPPFGQTRTAFCETLSGPGPGAYSVLVFETTDGGRTWLSLSAAGLKAPSSGTVQGFVVSPNFVHDHTLFVQDSTNGLQMSTDGGGTFHTADPSTATFASPPVVFPFAAAGVNSSIAQPGVIFVSGDGYVARIQPPLHAPIVANGFRGFVTFPPDWGENGPLFAGLGPEGVPGIQADAAVYSCDTSLTACVHPLAQMSMSSEWIGPPIAAPNFMTSHTLFGFTRDWNSGERVEAWISQDRANTWTNWSSLQALLDTVNSHAPAGSWAPMVAVNPSRPDEMYVRLSCACDRSGPPDEQVLVSRDGGRRWSLLGFHEGPGQDDFEAGGLPWYTGSLVTNNTFRNFLQLEDDGTLFSIASGPGGYSGVFCSTDGGVAWRKACATS